MINTIKNTTAKAYKYFCIFYTEKYIDTLSLEEFESLPFSFQLGLFIEFFDAINTDVQLYSTDQNVLEESIKEAFETYEEYLFLDS